jgi:hypothetical protein
MDLDGGVIHNEGRLKGWALKKIETFLGPEMGTSVASAIWAQKSLDFRAHPFKRPEKWISPHPNPIIQPHINNRYIGNFMDKRQERGKRFQGLFRDGL